MRIRKPTLNCSGKTGNLTEFVRIYGFLFFCYLRISFFNIFHVAEINVQG
ncbi:Uncharacterized protein dnm_085630 [Desulfonema magnum]|uniref:Uncharacterized protein n=1 Tax=Desulfonema magnum TaxID=45655 RepID=A0A975BVN7_9BACT|nr:Uncharacterized protein dnm_085630 [Desulfonema magnum]